MDLGIIGQPLFEAAAQTFVGAIAGYTFDNIKDKFFKDNSFDGSFDFWQRGIHNHSIENGDRVSFDGLISPFIQLFPRDPYKNAVRWNSLYNFEGTRCSLKNFFKSLVFILYLPCISIAKSSDVVLITTWSIPSYFS